MKAVILFLFFPILFFFTACSGTLFFGESVEERLALRLDAIFSDSIFVPTDASLLVVSLDRGDTLYDRRSTLLRHPASNNKLITSAAALIALGENFRFSTHFYSDEILSDSSVADLFIKGLGDPELKVKHLDSAAGVLRMLGVKRVAGDIVVDVSYFDTLSQGEGWMWDDEPEYYSAHISPLTVNKNSVRITVTPGDTIGSHANIAIDPPARSITVANSAITLSGDSTSILIYRAPGDKKNAIEVRGFISVLSEPRSRLLSVWKPQLFAGELFAEALRQRGLEVTGVVREGIVPEGRSPFLSIHTPLDSMLVPLNKISDNLSTENLLKTLGAEYFGPPGSAVKGIWAVNRSLATLGIDTNAFRQADGSGLSFYNRVSARTLGSLLAKMYRHPQFGSFYNSLPIAGVDGTLERRMRNTSAAGNLRAKTGTIAGVSTLSGYVRTRDGEMLLFSMMMQNFILPSGHYRRAQDRVGTALAEFSRNGRIIAQTIGDKEGK